ncbi:hypothetical protein K458DRAFT_160275 [Lentithecium fluviatile CBS 122367]|uniref:Uncharacterized protein n=1 Tax=Lentithecium fluviatile CBS 122367 TaxID=1168545 RepID=A0A6G1IHF3_9PLEO|nr:hypothetical protein K458DRAFT_160275 [Lentithecium fluviatile CBS 122367]
MPVLAPEPLMDREGIFQGEIGKLENNKTCPSWIAFVAIKLLVVQWHAVAFPRGDSIHEWNNRLLRFYHGLNSVHEVERGLKTWSIVSICARVSGRCPKEYDGPVCLAAIRDDQGRNDGGSSPSGFAGKQLHIDAMGAATAVCMVRIGAAWSHVSISYIVPPTPL